MKTLIIIPTYNEIENIRLILTKVLSLKIKDLEILVVDDGSPDGTADVVKEMMLTNSTLNVLERQGKRGLGLSYVSAFKHALEKDYDLIVQMDADFSHNPNYVANLLAETQENDVVIGSRYITGVNVVNWPFSRMLLSYFANMYTRLITGMSIQDCTAGFICYKREVLESIELEDINADGYVFQVEMKFRAYKNGYRLKEIPIIFVDRAAGKSKMSSKVIHEAGWRVLQLRVLSWFGKYKKAKKEKR